MLLQFRQGIAQSPSPAVVTVVFPYVNLNASTTNTIITFADGAKDYLYTEYESVTHAWGPLAVDKDHWLYWDLNTRTGLRTFGSTLFEPIHFSTPPASPNIDQHWFDTTTNTMKVWTGTTWSRRIRVFAAKISASKLPYSVGSNFPAYTGTQVANYTQIYAGTILFDTDTGNALRDSAGLFVTTESKLSSGTVSSSIKVAGLVVEGEAQQVLAARTIVVFSDFGQIVHANQFTANQSTQFGIIEISANINQIVPVITQGIVTSPDWDWTSVGINAPLYCDATGTIITSPVIPDQLPIGGVLDNLSFDEEPVLVIIQQCVTSKRIT